MTTPRIGLVLGGGGPSGVMHIPVLEAFDELGVRPAAIAGTSVGALIGAIYAAGLPANEIREHFIRQSARGLRQLTRVLLRGGLGFNRGLFAVNPERFAELTLPAGMPDRFEDLAIPFTAVAMDFHRKTAVTLDQGPLLPAIAASIAVPGVFKPVMRDGRPLVDGGVVENLPLTRLPPVDITLAVNVFTDRPSDSDKRPGNLRGAAAVIRTMLCKQVDAALAANPPDILIEAPIQPGGIGAMWHVRQILQEAEPMRAETLRRLSERLTSLPSG
ncbi:UPF0028 protein YchK [Candidatus Rhodobacter oscarellae]|uniref:UPF0028 protein YchK n=1 Tax=Candidatus Rhodobacter oscarellae TaxID=1675527 RepID=A0A0J9GXY6_9RHOB|nr:patatin-like phospholipase family protein [Candidatus Rhodobacter lobularis]KMW58348.1 UPF0028 protein YchK [Candidatus Rhodobacter lobularis]